MKSTIAVWILIALFISTPEARAQKPHLLVGYLAAADMMPALVAGQGGYFSQEGLDVALVVFRSGVQLMQAVVSGDAHIGMGSAPELLQAVNAGAKINAVWGISNLMPYALISRPQIRAFSELKGKKVAVSSPASLSDFLTRYVLKGKGLDPAREVTILSVGGDPTRFAALQSGSVDAAIISATHFAKAKQAGLNLLFMLSDLIAEWPLDWIFVRQEWLAGRESDFRAYLRGYRRGLAMAKKNPESAIQALQKGLRFDRQSATDGYQAYIQSLPEDGHIAEKGLELLMDQMMETGRFKRRLALTDFIDYRYINDARKERVK